MNGTTTTSTTASTVTSILSAAGASATLTDAAPVTGGRGVEVDDVLEMLAELRLLQQLRAA